MDRFPSRFAGSEFQPFALNVFEEDGSPRDLTGDTATFTIRLANGKGPVVAASAHTNVPGAAGVFEFQPTAAQMAQPGEYVVTIAMTLSGRAEVSRKGFLIKPAV